jgi:hypothetical protein
MLTPATLPTTLPTTTGVDGAAELFVPEPTLEVVVPEAPVAEATPVPPATAPVVLAVVCSAEEELGEYKDEDGKDVVDEAEEPPEEKLTDFR